MSSCKPTSQGVGNRDEQLASTESHKSKDRCPKCSQRRQNHKSLKGSVPSRQTSSSDRMASLPSSQPPPTSSQGTAPITPCEKRIRKTLSQEDESYSTLKVQTKSKANTPISYASIRHTRPWQLRLTVEAFSTRPKRPNPQTSRILTRDQALATEGMSVSSALLRDTTTQLCIALGSLLLTILGNRGLQVPRDQWTRTDRLPSCHLGFRFRVQTLSVDRGKPTTSLIPSKRTL